MKNRTKDSLIAEVKAQAKDIRRLERNSKKVRKAIKKHFSTPAAERTRVGVRPR